VLLVFIGVAPNEVRQLHYLCVSDIVISSFYDFSIRFWNCSDSVIFSE
jgi:hypothetical protein